MRTAYRRGIRSPDRMNPDDGLRTVAALDRDRRDGAARGLARDRRSASLAARRAHRALARRGSRLSGRHGRARSLGLAHAEAREAGHVDGRTGVGGDDLDLRRRDLDAVARAR